MPAVQGRRHRGLRPPGRLGGGTDEHGLYVDGGQGQAVRLPQTEPTLVKVPGVSEPDAELTASLLSLSDVMATGHHAALGARVAPGRTVVVVGDGAVGLCGVFAAKRLAKRIIAMSRYADRQALARDFGATDIVAERGDDGGAKVRGVLTDSVLECVGTKESMDQALHLSCIACVRAGAWGLWACRPGEPRCRCVSCSTRISPLPAAWHRHTLTSRSCWPMCSPAGSIRAGSLTWSCRWRRPRGV